jgi:hypothetical protein
MKEFTVVKYKPEFYVDGIYTKEEWISRYDIGDTFDGKLFEIDEYQRVEDNYVNFIKENTCRIRLQIFLCGIL